MKRTLAAFVLALALAACAGGGGPLDGPGIRRDPARVVDNRSNFARRLLEAHNAERARGGVPALTWSPALAAQARDWAQILARSGKLAHAPPERREGQGENLFTGTAGAYSLEDMIGRFLDERQDFRPGVFPEVSRTGRWQDVAHYTQIVWSGTREVGCALATGHGRDTLVCRYSPPGNVIGERVG